MIHTFHLTVDGPPRDITRPDVTDRTFYWHDASTHPWFRANVGPLLGALGCTEPRNIDLVRIATAVLAADRSASRSGTLSRWNQREFKLTVDVIDAKPWAAHAEALESLLAFLTGDIWHMHFRSRFGTPEPVAVVGLEASRVVLLSGGADSASGALLSGLELAATHQGQVLISHWSSPNLAPLQRVVASEIEKLAPGSTTEHLQVHIARGRQSPTGQGYGKEDSTRSRSLLFIALGLAVASAQRLPLWLPENGYASINPPLSRSRRGSLSTKTTHPKFLEDLMTLLDDVGAHSTISNPYAWSTKGEMFQAVSAGTDADTASRFLSATSSCSHTGTRSWGLPPHTACGECFGCVLRKASFQAARLHDTTPYFTPTTEKQITWLKEKSVVPAMRDFLREPFGEDDLASLRIPTGLALADVAAFCRRGRAELAEVML